MCECQQVRGPHVVARYYNSDARAADADGWFDTGVRTTDADAALLHSAHLCLLRMWYSLLIVGAASASSALCCRLSLGPPLTSDSNPLSSALSIPCLYRMWPP